MSDVEGKHDFFVTAVSGRQEIARCLPRLQQLALLHGQPGTMHGLDLLLGSQFLARKRACLLCFSRLPDSAEMATQADLVGAVLLLEYRPFRLPTGIFATGDAFGVRTVAGPAHLQATLCLHAGRFLLRRGARLVLTTWRRASPRPVSLETDAGVESDGFLYAAAQRIVQDTLLLGPSADQSLMRLGKRTRVHLRAARRRFDREYANARLEDAIPMLAAASDAMLQQLNRQSLDVIDQHEFNHQARSLCQHEGGFALGLRLDERWIALIGGWHQGDATWIEWQCNARGFEKLSLGSVLRTYLLEEEERRGSTTLSFHGGTSHSMLHSFQQTSVEDLLMRRPGLFTGLLVRLTPWLCARFPSLLERGNFIFNALCARGLCWSASPSMSTGDPGTAQSIRG